MASTFTTTRPRRNCIVLWTLVILAGVMILSFKGKIDIKAEQKGKGLIMQVNEQRREQTGLRGFRPGLTQTGLYSLRSRLEA